MSHEDVENLYDRLRETEAQTREQNERINALTSRVDVMLTRWDEQMKSMWRLIYILVTALVSIALGPKVAEKIMSNGSGVPVSGFFHNFQDIAPWHGDRFGVVNKKVALA